LRTDPQALDAVLTGHAHIDLVWLWPERVGEAKAVHSFATADRPIDMYPQFRFAYSQTASYAAVSRSAPTLHRRVLHRIGQKRWEASGAMEVESDMLPPCGEALARSFLLGQQAFAGLRGGKPSRLLWLPDVFGYAGCLPQLMRQTGVEYFFTTKMTWGAVTKFPYSSFVWRGDDGSEVVAHIVSQNFGYNGKTSLGELKGHAFGHRQSDVHHEFLAPTGYGDGGGGPTEEMCERARRVANLASLPRVKWGGVEPFFDRLAKLRAKLPTYRGECYLEYHRGVFTTVRSQQPGRPQDEAMWEVPGSRWAAVSDEGEHDGLLVVTGSKYGFSARDGTLGVSLLRTVPITGYDQKHAAAHAQSLLRERTPTPHLADLGRHEIALALGRYDSWAKPLARGRWPLRLHETLGRRGAAQLRLAAGWTARRTDLLEKPGALLREGRVPFRPYEIVSVIVEAQR